MDGAWEGFKRRHPEITLRKPEPVSHVRANCAQPEVLRRYFDELEVILKGNEIIESPSAIFNMDELKVDSLLIPNHHRLFVNEVSTTLLLSVLEINHKSLYWLVVMLLAMLFPPLLFLIVKY